jgi:hypothetical protein
MRPPGTQNSEGGIFTVFRGAVVPRGWGSPHSFYFSLSSHDLFQDTDTVVGSTQ